MTDKEDFEYQRLLKAVTDQIPKLCANNQNNQLSRESARNVIMKFLEKLPKVYLGDLFDVICDETNNTPETAGYLVATIKPLTPYAEQLLREAQQQVDEDKENGYEPPPFFNFNQCICPKEPSDE